MRKGENGSKYLSAVPLSKTSDSNPLFSRKPFMLGNHVFRWNNSLSTMIKIHYLEKKKKKKLFITGYRVLYKSHTILALIHYTPIHLLSPFIYFFPSDLILIQTAILCVSYSWWSLTILQIWYVLKKHIKYLNHYWAEYSESPSKNLSMVKFLAQLWLL